MRAIVPRDVGKAVEAEISLIDECGWLERVTGALGAQVTSRDRAQLRVDERKKTLEGTVIPLLPSVQVRGDLLSDRKMIQPDLCKDGYVARCQLPVARCPLPGSKRNWSRATGRNGQLATGNVRMYPSLVEDIPSLICDLARSFYQLGWASGTGGGICIRDGEWPAKLHDVEETESIILQEQRMHAADSRATESRQRGA